MKFPIILLLCLAASSAALTPPQAFRNVNLVRSINLEKGYVKETINVVIENIDKQAQDEYYLPVGPEVMAKLGGLEIRDKKDTSKPAFSFESVLDHEISSPQHYKIKLPEPLVPNAQQTLTISYHLLSSLFPLPKEINQQDPQYLLHKFSLYAPSAYLTSKQKLKIKFPTTDVPEYTGTPETQGSTFTYGPYEDIAAGAENEASVRYEYTKPLIHTTLLERDIEVSHWGGNLAFEERHWMINKAASLANHFSRVTWAASQFYNPPSPAIKELKVPLKVGSLNPYFTDEIGNVSTSHFRSNTREAVLELKPRYPVFGGWAFPFRIGWDANLNNFLGSTGSGQYVLKVPFLEGPKMSEGVSYDKVELRVILPEGAIDVDFQTTLPGGLHSHSTTIHKTFMDTLGRTTLKLTALNVIDESRDVDLIVTYTQPPFSNLRKPLMITVAVFAVFTAAWVVGSLDVSIGGKGKKLV